MGLVVLHERFVVCGVVSQNTSVRLLYCQCLCCSLDNLLREKKPGTVSFCSRDSSKIYPGISNFIGTFNRTLPPWIRGFLRNLLFPDNSLPRFSYCDLLVSGLFLASILLNEYALYPPNRLSPGPVTVTAELNTGRTLLTKWSLLQNSVAMKWSTLYRVWISCTFCNRNLRKWPPEPSHNQVVVTWCLIFQSTKVPIRSDILVRTN